MGEPKIENEMAEVEIAFGTSSNLLEKLNWLREWISGI